MDIFAKRHYDSPVAGKDITFKLRQTSSEYNLLHLDASDQRVGISTTTPTEKLDVSGTINATNYKVGGAQGSDGQVLTSTGSGVAWEAIPASGTFNEWAPNSGHAIVYKSGSHGYLSIYQSDGSTIGARIHSNGNSFFNGGNVGIGTDSPTAVFHTEKSYNGLLAYLNQTHASGLGLLIKATGTGSSEYLLKLQGNAGSTEAMFVGKDGKVGIAAVSPVEKLDVRGDILSTGDVTILQNQFLRADNSAGAGINSNRIKLKNSSTGNMEFTLESNDWDFAFTNGKVGIGTTSPVEKLDISAGNIRLDNQQMLTFATTDSESGRVGIQGDESSDFLRFRTDNTNRMAITNSGVGIYTLSPNSDYSLTVQQPTGTNKDYLLGVQDNGSNTAFKIDTDSGDNVALRLFNGSSAEKIYFNVGGHSRIGNSANTNTITFDTANGSIYYNTT